MKLSRFETGERERERLDIIVTNITIINVVVVVVVAAAAAAAAIVIIIVVVFPRLNAKVPIKSD